MRVACNEVEALLDEQLDATLRGPARVFFAVHWSACAGCRRYGEEYRKTIALLHEFCRDEADSDTQLPQEYAEAVLQAIAQASMRR